MGEIIDVDQYSEIFRVVTDGYGRLLLVNGAGEVLATRQATGEETSGADLIRGLVGDSLEQLG